MRQLRTWPPPAAGALLTEGVRPLPFPLAEPGVRVYAQARQALRTCLPAVGLRRDDEVLVPSYHHGSEVEAILQAGLRCRVYEPGPDLQPDETELERLVGPRTRALHLVHHLGFPQDAARWRRWCDARGLLLVEDAAQAWLATRDGAPVGAHGDLAVFCLYKSVGVPDGAAVRAREPLPVPEARGAAGVAYFVKPLARSALHRAGRHPGAGEYDQAADIEVPVTSRAESAATRLLLPRTRLAGVAGARRRRYEQLLDSLRDLVPAPFSVLPPGASPFAFPIAVRDKPAALESLAARGIDGLDLWRLPHPGLPARPGSPSALLRQHVLGLPVHQGLGPADVARLVEAARQLPPARFLQAAVS